jgi:hypothetical protein
VEEMKRYRILLRKPERKRPFRRPNTDGRVILNCTLGNLLVCLFVKGAMKLIILEECPCYDAQKLQLCNWPLKRIV